jgi:hypothetical protein
MPDYEFPLVSFSAGKEGEEDSLSSSLILLYANLILNTDRSSILKEHILLIIFFFFSVSIYFFKQ